MLKHLSVVFAILVVVAVCDGQNSSSPPQGKCESCNDRTMEQLFRKVASFAEGKEPIKVVFDQEVCKKVVITGLSTMVHHGKSCMISEANNKWLQTGIMIKDLRTECYIIPLKDLAHRFGIKMPIISLPSIKSPILYKSEEVTVVEKTEEVTVVENIFRNSVKDTVLDIVAKMNFDEGTINITKFELPQGILNNMIRLEGGNNEDNVHVRMFSRHNAFDRDLGKVIVFALRQALSTLMNDKNVKKVITVLNCEH